MLLTNVTTRNFRNLENIDYEAVPGLNVFMGDNAQGKTNLLEAIYFLAAGNSFRTNSEKLLVRNNENIFKISGRHFIDQRKIETDVDYSLDKGKIIKINRKKVTKNNPDRLRVVIFTPDDLYLIKGSPVRRRNYLDFFIKQISAEYSAILDEYNKILKKRNECFRKDQIHTKSFAIINDLFIEYAVRVIHARIKFLNIISRIAEEKYHSLSMDNTKIRIKYALSFAVEEEKVNTQTLINGMKKCMEEKKEYENKRKTSIIGPHLDDINIYLDNQQARAYASQGQQRNIAISLKLSELYAIKELADFYPVLLLDEVLAELDHDRRNFLLEELQNKKYQCFLTSVYKEELLNVGGVTSIVQNGTLLKRG